MNDEQARLIKMREKRAGQAIQKWFDTVRDAGLEAPLVAYWLCCLRMTFCSVSRAISRAMEDSAPEYDAVIDGLLEEVSGETDQSDDS